MADDQEKTAEQILVNALKYIGAHYGGTSAHHILSRKLEEIRQEDDILYEDMIEKGFC